MRSLAACRVDRSPALQFEFLACGNSPDFLRVALARGARSHRWPSPRSTVSRLQAAVPTCAVSLPVARSLNDDARELCRRLRSSARRVPAGLMSTSIMAGLRPKASTGGGAACASRSRIRPVRCMRRDQLSRYSVATIPLPGFAQPRRMTRALSRCQSRSFSVARLSCCFLPLARPISSLARPSFQCRSSGTSV